MTFALGFIIGGIVCVAAIALVFFISEELAVRRRYFSSR